MNRPNHRPSRIGRWILGKITDRNIRYSAMGDFEEEYHNIAETQGIFRARLWYWGQIIESVPKFILDTSFWSIVMLKNHFKIAMRNILRHKGYSFICHWRFAATGHP